MTIDLHCHILPGIDDGAADVRDSIAMARQAAVDGIEAICATPHIRHDHDVRIYELEGRIADLNRELDAAGVPVSVIAGGEVAETAVDGLDDGELRTVGLGQGDWILLEPRPGPLSDSLERTVAGLAERGFRSLIAHPERHGGEDLPQRLRRLIEAGVLVQATAAYLLAADTAEWMLGLARQGLVHVLGSDSHSSRAGRPVALAAALGALAGEERVRPHLEWVGGQAPRAIVTGSADLAPPFDPGWESREVPRR